MARASEWKSRLFRITAGLPCIALAACVSLATKAERRGGDSVTQWTLIADYYGNRAANWRTLAVMQMAMHDALNAAHPVYNRWWPAAAGEPAEDKANPEVAMAAAADEVLALLHPDRDTETAAAFATILARYPDDAGKAAGIDLGKAIGRAAVERRSDDGFDEVRFFHGNNIPGRWRPTPTLFGTSPTNGIRPFLFRAVSDVPAVPPPTLGSPEYLRELAEARSLGALHSTERTADETAAALFWAHQTSQRGFVDLAVRLLAAHRPLGGVYAEAHIMAELTAALADSAIITWNEKAKYSFWRPITAMRAQSADDVAWTPLVETPPFPEYPSGHATDCYVGAGVLEAAFPNLPAPIVYLSSAHMEPLGGGAAPPPTIYGMGQHAQPDAGQAPGESERRFSSLGAAAENCARSRIWAGAHFLAAEVESNRLASIIVRQALTTGGSVPATVTPTASTTPPLAERGSPAAQ
jgi:hypothetical protein